jgi:hypothetical protein
MHADDAANRILAIQLACQSGLDLLKEIAGLLDDSSTEVRREAMMAIATDPKSTEVIDTDALLRLLHDDDEEVVRQCELALAARGLDQDQMRLGRLITDSQPAVRLEVLKYIRPGSKLDAGVWLRHLSHDPAPAVRSAAIRASYNLSGLRDRLDQMAQSDSSPTVRQLARYYLSMQAGENQSNNGN